MIKTAKQKLLKADLLVTNWIEYVKECQRNLDQALEKKRKAIENRDNLARNLRELMGE